MADVKNIVITGASAGIGESCARAFARKNHRLFLGARRIDRLRRLKEELLNQGASEVYEYQLDVTDDRLVSQFCQESLEVAQGQIDCVINNAGLALGLEPIAEGNPKDWQKVLDTNVMGVLRICRGLLSQMINQASGHLIFLSSIAAHQVYEGGGVYCASKHAVKALAQALKLELNGTGIRVTTIDPGMVETEFSRVRFRGDRKKAAQVYQGLAPLTGEDIANSVLFAFEQPAHVNLDQLIVMPTAQASVYKVSRS